MNAPNIDSADHVLHRPSGETWVVAFVRDGKLCACGWPLELVPLADCELTEKATEAARVELLTRMADTDSADIRAAYASAALRAVQGDTA